MILTINKIRHLCFTGFLKLFVASCVDPGELIGSAPTLGFTKPTGFVLTVKLLLRKIVSSLNYFLISAYFVELFQSYILGCGIFFHLYKLLYKVYKLGHLLYVCCLFFGRVGAIAKPC